MSLAPPPPNEDQAASPHGETVIGGHVFRWGSRTYLMGVVNVTPDSFSGDGIAGDATAAADLAERMAADGAHLIDVGGESTRPGAAPVDADDELRRVVPAVEAIVRRVRLPVSVDTSKAVVAEAALAAGASIINDVWALGADPRMPGVAAQAGAPVVLMHNGRGVVYRNLVPDVIASLRSSIRIAEEAGITSENVIVDPGIGFGKTPEQNLELLRRLGELRVLGRPVLVGASRKSTIGLVLDLPPDERLEGGAATVAVAIANGADLVRVHDVKEMARVAKMSDAIVRGWSRNA